MADQGLAVRAAKKAAFLISYYCVRPIARLGSLLGTVYTCRKIVSRIDRVNNVALASKSFSEEHDLGLHILTSHADLESFVLSLTSFYAHSDHYPEVVLHEDGTFTAGDIWIVRWVFPWIRIVRLKEADERLRREGFEEATILARHNHKLLIKAIDFHFIDEASRILILDSDVFIFGKLSAVWDLLVSGEKLIFNEDPAPAYGDARAILEDALGRPVTGDEKPYVNTGFIVEPSQELKAKKSIIDKYCAELATCNLTRPHCVEQGLVAWILKDAQITARPLPNEYVIRGDREPEAGEWISSLSGKLQSNAIETLHLCGWDKRGKAFSRIKRIVLDKARGRTA